MLNEYYFQTMHHEFAHILHQTKNFDPSFERITENSYVGSDWYIKTDPVTGLALHVVIRMLGKKGLLQLTQ